MSLKLTIFHPEITVECEVCGYALPLLKSEVEDLPDFIECSTCAAERWHEYRLKKLKETHTPRRMDRDGQPIQIPPMIRIDTRDLPGFAKDKAAERIGTQIALFKTE
jgi:hypothetical protein